MKNETIALLKSIKKTSERYQGINLSLENVEMIRNDVSKSLSRVDVHQRDFLNYMCNSFKNLIEMGDEIFLPDALEANYTESQITQYLIDLIEI